MDFLEILKDMVDKVDNGFAATIMGMDGIAIQDYAREGAKCDVETLGVEYGNVISEIKKASRILSLGELEEVMVTSGKMRVLMRLATQQYFIAFVISAKANAGKARYLLRRAAKYAAEELTK